MTEHLRFAPTILARLGEELIPHPDQGILELVRNAYDADAPDCSVTLSETDEPGGTIVVADSGDGMTPAQISEGWLVLGRSIKDPEERTPRFKRLPVGEKGLGRLAALRLGRCAKVITRPVSRPGKAYEVVFDWEKFDRADTVDEVPIAVKSKRTKKNSGTEVVIEGLRDRLTRADVKRLARALLLLIDPFKASQGFQAQLVAPGFEDIEDLVSSGNYLDLAAYEIRGKLSSKGLAHAEVIDHDAGAPIVGDHDDIAERYHDGESYRTPAADLHIWVIPRGGSGLQNRSRATTVGGIREWLDEVGGVHIYHRGLRVYPYGDPGYDWFDMNRMRASSPEERPSTNNSVGRVIVKDPKNRLRQKTDRTGFIENTAFLELRAFAHDVVDWAGRERLKRAEARREKARRKSPANVDKARSTLGSAIAKAPKPARKDLEKAQKKLERATDREIKVLQSDLELYRTLGTIGTTTAMMAHEAFTPAGVVLRMGRAVEKKGKQLLGESYEKELGNRVDLILAAGERISVLVELPRRLLEASKRRRRALAPNSAISETVDLLRPILDEHGVDVKIDLEEGVPQIIGTVAAVESIVANLITNSIHALDSKPKGSRRLLVRTESENGSISLLVSDNGPGIRKVGVDEIFLPGETTTKNGIGLGLTIVRDAVTSLDGSVSARSSGELGGAEFLVELPAVPEDS
jgi:signal transduction histidine kinase